MMFKYTFFITITSTCTLLWFLFEPIPHGIINTKTFSERKVNINEKIVGKDLKLDVKEVDDLVKSFMNANKIPGLSLSISQNKKEYYSASYGYSIIEDKTAFTLEHKSRIGSVSKPIASALLGKLVDDNILALDAPLSQYIKNLPKHIEPITLRQLASHQSGIRNYGWCFCFPVWEYYNTVPFASEKDALNIFIADELLYTPGERFSYSTYNYTLLGAVIESVTGKNVATLSKELLFNDLDMMRTGAELLNDDELVSFYSIDDGSYTPAFPVNNSNKMSGGGFVSTAKELAVFGSALVNGELLSDTISKEIFTPQTLNNGESNKRNYGLGWNIGQTTEGFAGDLPITFYVHEGSAVGAGAILLMFPKQKLVMAITINRDKPRNNSLGKVSFEIAELFL